MPLLKTKALPVSDVPNCESWGNLYGTTYRGGTANAWVVYKVGP